MDEKTKVINDNDKNQENEIMQPPDEDSGLENVQRIRPITGSSWADEVERSTPFTHTEFLPIPVKPPASRVTRKNANPVRSQGGHLYNDRGSHMTLGSDEDHSVTAEPWTKLILT